jgi:hypothetical protein
MVIAADYPFLSILGTMIIFFAWVCWIWLVIVIFTDIFRRRDTSGFAKAAWIIFIILIPFVGVLIYLIAQHEQMAERSAEAAQQMQAQTDDYIRNVAASEGPAGQIEKAKSLLDSGAISQAEFDSLKAKALAT